MKKRLKECKRRSQKASLDVFIKGRIREVGEVNAAIFEMHQMMLDDLDYVESITN